MIWKINNMSQSIYPYCLLLRDLLASIGVSGCCGSVIGSWLLDLTESLYSRFVSQGHSDFADKIQSAQRKQFGGHDEKKE